MKPLLEFDSPIYLKRLVRELNQSGIIDGFYAPYATFAVRCNRARLKDGAIECRSPSVQGNWFTPSNLHFSDGHGREVVACRVVKH